MMSKLRIASLLVALFLSGCQTLPYAAVTAPPRVVEVADGSAARASQNARVYDAAVAMVARRFYNRAAQGAAFRLEAAARRGGAVAQPDEAGFYAALNDALKTLDDNHTRVEGPAAVRQARQWRTSATPTFGIQFVLVTHEETGEKRQYVTRVRPDGPAAQAGVQPGWLVRTLNGEPWVGSRVRDDADNIVEFEDHEGRIHQVTMNPVHLGREIGYLTRRPDGVAIIGFSDFDSATVDWLEARLTALKADPPAAIVLNLRGNPGGSQRSLSRILGFFFTERFQFGSTGALDLESRISQIFGFAPTRTRSFRDPWTGALAVVQSNLSASAAEIFAAAIQDCDRGAIVGQQSAGAVVGAQEFWLPDGGLLTVGVAELRTITGKVIEKTGVTPDIAVALTYDDVRTGRDVMLEAAVSAVLAENRSSSDWTTRLCASPAAVEA